MAYARPHIFLYLFTTPERYILRFQDRGRRGQLQRQRRPPVRGVGGVAVPVELERERDGNTRAVEVNNSEIICRMLQ